jgi:hypothetical protein
MSAASLRGRHPFPEAGEGVVLHFKFSDLDALQAEYKENWINVITHNLDHMDMPTVAKVVSCGAKKDDKPFKVDFNKIEVPLVDLVKIVLDGFYLAIHGMSVADFGAKIENALAEAKAKSGGDDPLTTGLSPESS